MMGGYRVLTHGLMFGSLFTVRATQTNNRSVAQYTARRARTRTETAIATTEQSQQQQNKNKNKHHHIETNSTATATTTVFLFPAMFCLLSCSSFVEHDIRPALEMMSFAPVPKGLELDEDPPAATAVRTAADNNNTEGWSVVIQRGLL